MIRTLIDHGINWNWYLQADFNDADKTCHIYFHDRWHKYEERGSKHPQHENVGFLLLEDGDRVVYGVRVCNASSTGMPSMEYLVTNPAYVFDYKDMMHYVPEAKA